MDPNTARTTTAHAIRAGREFISYSDNTSFTRKLDRATGAPTTAWIPVDTPPSPTTNPPHEPPRRHLLVIAEHQAAGEPKHWSLFSYVPNPTTGTGTDTNTGPGESWQVTGDAEFMRFEHAENVDRLASPDYAWHRVLSADLSDVQLAVVDAVARAETPPRAESRAEVREHCQGWTVRVVRRLVAEGVVEGGTGREGEGVDVVGMLEGFMDPLGK